MKLLLVDDDAFLRDMYATKFGERGHTVEVAATGEAAVRLLEENKFDVVLLDLIMPGMSGIELLETIKNKYTENAPVCIVLSNQGSEEDIREAKTLGAKGYIVKAEMIPSEVVEKVEKLVSS
jgi:CheY-like chemotaxis protein